MIKFVKIRLKSVAMNCACDAVHQRGENVLNFAQLKAEIRFSSIYFFNLFYLFVYRHEVHSLNTHCLHNSDR